MEADGVLLVDKPTGCTSHDVVDFVRRRFHFKKVGHCGTLDPLATGLLMLVIGKATKIQDLLMAEDKEYAGTMKLGVSTDSQDSDGKVIEERPVPELTTEQIDAAFKKYVGDFYQMPPMVSALKQGGVPLYKLARGGQDGRTRAAAGPYQHIYHRGNRAAADQISHPVQQGLLRPHLLPRHRQRSRLRRASRAVEPHQVRQLFARTRHVVGHRCKKPTTATRSCRRF